MTKNKLDLVGFSNEVLVCARELGVELAIAPKTLTLVGAYGLTTESRTDLLSILVNLKTLLSKASLSKEDLELGQATVDGYIDFLLLNDLETLNRVN